MLKPHPFGLSNNTEVSDDARWNKPALVPPSDLTEQKLAGNITGYRQGG